jgi:hypothetical protein
MMVDGTNNAIVVQVLQQHQDRLTNVLQVTFDNLLPVNPDAKDVSFARKMLIAMCETARQRITTPKKFSLTTSAAADAVSLHN